MSNTLTFSGSTPNMNNPYVYTFTSSESPSFYATNVNVGSIFNGAYTLSGSWGTSLATPYIYINFMAAGPIPITQFCSDVNTYIQCRIYASKINVVVAQFK
jgi:hypothetical protein